MKCRAIVSFEYDLKPVQTARFDVEAGTVGAVASQAARRAKKELRPHSWRSFVVCIERLADVDEPEIEESETGDGAPQEAAQ